MNRRAAMKLGAATAITFGFGFWRDALAVPAVLGEGPYGPLGAADRLGVRLPAGFSARLKRERHGRRGGHPRLR